MHSSFVKYWDAGTGKTAVGLTKLPPSALPGASHTDLYDNLVKIPFDRIEQFYKENMK